MKARPHTGKSATRPVSRDAGIVMIVSVVLSMVALVGFAATLPA